VLAITGYNSFSDPGIIWTFVKYGAGAPLQTHKKSASKLIFEALSIYKN